MRKIIVISVFLSVFLSFNIVNAQVEFKDTWSPAHEEIAQARPLAMGRAFIAIAEGNSAYYYNPAGAAQDLRFNIAIDSEFDPLGERMSFAASVLDSMTSALCAQIGYTYSQYQSRQFWKDADMEFIDKTKYYIREGKTAETNYTLDTQSYTPPILSKDPTDFRQMFGQYKSSTVQRHIPRLALAGAINRFFYIGVTGKYIYVQRPMRHSVNSVNVDVGLMVNTDFGLRFGVVGYNLIHNAYELWPLKLGAGIAFAIKDVFYISYDQIVIFDVYQEKEPDSSLYKYPEGIRLAMRAGIEYVVTGMIALRAGYEFDQSIDDYHYISGGLAYVDPQFSVSLSYSQNLILEKNRLISFSVDFEL